VGALQSPVAAGAAARALKNVCEEVTAVTSEASSLEGLLHIGEVSDVPFPTTLAHRREEKYTTNLCLKKALRGAADNGDARKAW
jgi:hypothetical protein